MKTNQPEPGKSSSKSAHLSRAAVLAILGLATAPAHAVTNVTYTVEAAVKEAYDSNVYIQDNKPTAGNVAIARAAGFSAVEARKESFVTSFLPRFAVNYKPCDEFNLVAAYAPEITLYTSAEDEDYVAHRGTLNFTGKCKDVTWELLNSATFIEGSTEGPTFARPGDVPAIGGIPLRDRREAFVFRNSFRVTVPIGNWFIRPVATSYYHDFMTDQHLNTASAHFCYENYLDRQDVNGGVDVGYKVSQATFVTLGYRYGRQDQFVGPNASNTAFVDSAYDSSYHRILVGVEGSPAKWLKVNFQIGPEFRHFEPGTDVGFERNQMLYYVDGSVTVLPTTADTVSFRWTRFEQPAFSSQSVYEDIKYDLAWRHKFGSKFTVGPGLTYYRGGWQQPVHRDDWIYTISAAAAYAFDKHFSTELAYSFDWAENHVPTNETGTTFSSGREFSRHIVSLMVKYVF